MVAPFFTARVFLVEISLLFLEITGHLLVTYMQNISDCSIREYRSIVATITGHQALSPGAQRIIPYILIKTAYFNYADISASFKKFRQKLHLATCFRDHKIGYAAAIYKSIKTVHF